MTIRYTCTECSSVLKIKDEKAGTKGKCPKCKTEFLIPQPEADDGTAADEAGPDSPVDSVDMPIDLTPEFADTSDFDPTDVLGGSPVGKSSSFGPSANVGDRKPSVAELMKDFEATKKKDRKEKSAPEISRPAGPAASSASSAIQTAGSAADALSRAYQNKREAASAPTVRPQDVKAAAERALLVDFIKTRGLPAVVGILVLVYAYNWWMNYVPWTGPPLFDVTGSVMTSGKPVPGVSITFRPTIKDPTDLRSTASGITDAEGNFVLSYTATQQGAPVGEYDVEVFKADGNPGDLVSGESHVTVREDGPNEFKFEL